VKKEKFIKPPQKGDIIKVYMPNEIWKVGIARGRKFVERVRYEKVSRVKDIPVAYLREIVSVIEVDNEFELSEFDFFLSASKVEFIK
jgi:hypothetical protein